VTDGDGRSDETILITASDFLRLKPDSIVRVHTHTGRLGLEWISGTEALMTAGHAK
jgi:hypothetical protein